MQCGHGESGIKSTQPSLGGSKFVFISIINITFFNSSFQQSPHSHHRHALDTFIADIDLPPDDRYHYLLFINKYLPHHQPPFHLSGYPNKTEQ